MVTMLLEARNLRFAYLPGQTVLHDVSLGLEEGQILYLLGRNGGGKSTLLACLAGLLTPDRGQVRLSGRDITTYSARERARLVGLIPQAHTPVFTYTVAQMVMMGRAPHWGWLGSPSPRDTAVVENAMAQVGITELGSRPYTELSGGERQLVRIARGLAQRCRLLLMDEPTAHLDLSNQHRVLEIIHQLRDQGLSFIIASHAPNDALTYADQVLLLTGGWVTAQGSPAETLTEPLLSSAYGIRTQVIYGDAPMNKKPRAVMAQRPITLLPKSLEEPNSLLSRIFHRREEEPQLILVTGLSGAGKTTWCTRLVAQAQQQGLAVEGVLSPGVFEGGEKTAIDVMDLSSGEKRRLANLREDDSARLSTPRWAFHPEALAWANQALAQNHQGDLLVIDELGPLEFFRGEGLLAGMERLDRRAYQVACVVVRSSLTPNAIQRWPEALVVNGRVNGPD